MKVLNIFAGPGVGKSTTAAGIFHEMKMKLLNVELVTEYAKDMTWEGRDNVLDDQLYILAKQNRRIQRLKGKVDYVITDSPLILGLIYARPDYYRLFEPFLLEVWDSYENMSFLLQRGDGARYQEIGRNQNLDEAKVYDAKLERFLRSRHIPFTEIKQSPTTVDEILAHLKLTS